MHWVTYLFNMAIKTEHREGIIQKFYKASTTHAALRNLHPTSFESARRAGCAQSFLSMMQWRYSPSWWVVKTKHLLIDLSILLWTCTKDLINEKTLQKIVKMWHLRKTTLLVTFGALEKYQTLWTNARNSQRIKTINVFFSFL